MIPRRQGVRQESNACKAEYMSDLFTHSIFDHYSYLQVPLGKEIYLVDVANEFSYHDMMVNHFGGRDYDCNLLATPAVVHSINANGIELSWCSNVYTRQRAIHDTLPIDQFCRCVASSEIGEDPVVFTSSEWLRSIYLKK